MYKYSLGGIVMHSGSNKLAVGILTLMGYDFKETQSAYAFFSSDRKIISFVPKKEYEASMAKQLLENSVKNIYNNWCLSHGAEQVECGLADIYSTMYSKVDKDSKEYKEALKKGLIFKPQKENVFMGAVQEAVA